eukprot:CAMPEP_0196576438 /NCGR_PEP_ID=MMETSP1081-20130531/5689_1 /TAXON_ID=36882 /ORGANISM="Pyramimonas amylifera, Strain CCMP720" /LENGTH=594 /DNA_ID=CAMNT_0041895037 /DNA_START=128 /DNA_END=1912 /DNA_ORIENTATION=+
MVTAGHVIAMTLQWMDLFGSFFMFGFFYYQKQVKKRCKFEVLYTTGVGSITDLLKLIIVGYVPAVFTILENGNKVYWSRWFSWLCTCPVLLIHLSNLPGKEIFNVRRMMKMLIGYQLTTCCGITASMIDTDFKYFFICLAWFFCTFGIFRYAKDIFLEAIATMPLRAKSHLYRMAFVFFHSWIGFGIFFVLSPEGAGLIHKDISKAAWAYCDIMSKTVYAWHGWYLRWYILRKPGKPEEFVAVEGATEDDSNNDVHTLLIEKENTFSLFFKDILVQHHCTVVIVKTASEALAKIKETAKGFEIIFVNHEMAKDSDYSIMKEIRSVVFMLPVIAYGRSITKEHMDKKSQVGIDDFLHAPFPDEEIKGKIMKWCRRMSVLTDVRASFKKLATMNTLQEDEEYTEDPSPRKVPEKKSKNTDWASKNDPSNDLSERLQMLMDQLAELKTTTVTATDNVNRRLESTELRLSMYGGPQEVAGGQMGNNQTYTPMGQMNNMGNMGNMGQGSHSGMNQGMEFGMNQGMQPSLGMGMGMQMSPPNLNYGNIPMAQNSLGGMQMPRGNQSPPIPINQTGSSMTGGNRTPSPNKSPSSGGKFEYI